MADNFNDDVDVKSEYIQLFMAIASIILLFAFWNTFLN